MAGPLSRLSRLDSKFRDNKDLTAKLFVAGQEFSTMTLFLVAALQRLESNGAAFRAMIESVNYPVACAILRMQIDTAMRVNGLRLMADPHEGVKTLLQNQPYQKIKPKSGDKLRDAVLLDALDKQHGWVKRVYGRISGMVHLSGMHIHHIFDHKSSVETEDGHLSIDVVIGPSSPQVSEELLDEVSEAFVHITLIASDLISDHLAKEQHRLN